MRLLLYNIRYGTGIGHRFHLPIPYIGYLKPTNGNLKQITDFIKSKNPDIIGLVEVDSGSFRSDKQNQAADIAREIKHYHVFRTKYPAQSLVQRIPVLNKQGNAFLTNQKVKAEKFHYLSEGVKRLVMELELEKLTIFLVHLSIKFRHRQNCPIFIEWT